MNIVGIHTSLNKYQVKPTIANRIKPSGLARNKRNDITMINRIIKIALVFLFTLTAQFSFAQTASLLPNGMQQFFDNDGNPLSSGTVDFYIPSTTTRKNTWQNSTETIVNTNPVVLDAAGRAIIYGDGVYRQILKDRLGNTIWDKTTTSNVTGGTIITTGDGDLVGTVKPWAGIIAPNQYAFSFGQEVSRTTYSALLTAITQSATVICTSASNTITGLADTTQVPVGAKVELTCVPAGTTVVSKTVSSLTLSNPANVSINATAVIFPFGNGNGTTTFNIPDLRGYVVAGRDNMGGSAANRFSTFFGTNSASATGQTGGSPSLTVALANLPSHNHTIYDPGHTHLLAVGNDSASSGTFQQSSNNTKTQLTASSTTGIITQNSGGSGLAVSATLDAAGSGYTNGAQVLTVSGGTCSVQPTFNVTVAGNVVTAIVSLANAGNCTVIPANPVSTTGGGGTNATLNVAFTAQPISQVQPTITLNYIIKITPDTSAQAASGVSSLGGMIGDIACSTGILCTGNNISVNLTLPWTSITATPTTIAGYGITNARTQLTTNRLYFVNAGGAGTACGTTGILVCAAGSDSNDGLSNTTPFLTINHAISVIQSKIDMAGNSITVNLSHSTFGSIGCFGTFIGNTTILIQGDTLAKTAAVVQASGGNDGVFVKDFCGLQIDSFQIAQSGGAQAMHVGQVGVLDPSNITVTDFVGQVHFQAEGSGAIMNIGAGNVIAGNAAAIIGIGLNSTVKIVGAISIPVAKAFTWSVLVQNLGVLNSTLAGSTFTGAGVAATTGVRALVQSNGILALNGTACATVFPGNQACQFQTGGNDDAGEGGSSRQMISQSATNVATAGATVFCGSQGCQASQAAVAMTMPFGGTIKNFFFNVATAPGAAQTYTLTVFTGIFGSASASAITCPINGAAAVSCSDTTHSVALTAGQVFVVQLVGSAGAAATGGSSWGIEIDNP